VTARSHHTKGERGYVRVAEQYRQGTLQFVEPLDQLILAGLPKQGATLAGVIPLGETVQGVIERLDTDGLDGPMVYGRLRSLFAAGLCVHIRLPRSGVDGWQLTPEGEKFVQAWQNGQAEKEKEE
jgi:hypothetical protein